MFRACHAHNQELFNVFICRSLHISSTPDDKHDMLETCTELQINKYIKKNLCIKLDNYQESVLGMLSIQYKC